MIGKKITTRRALQIALLSTPLLMAGAAGVACGQQGSTSTKQQQPAPASPTGQSKQAVTSVLNSPLFEIDNTTNGANTVNDPSTPGDDWQNVIGTTGFDAGSEPSHANETTFVADGVGNVTYFTGGGSKDPNDVSEWRHKSGAGGGPPDKDDIVNAYAAAYTAENGDLIIAFGADRTSTDGDAQMGFWFFKDAVGFDPARPGRFTGHHLDGDLLVIVDFINGGTQNHIQVFKWSCPGATTGEQCGSTGSLQALTGDDTSSDARVCNKATGGFEANIACAATNRLPTPAFWPYEVKGVGTVDTIPPLGMVEGIINATALSNVTCLSAFAVETRAAHSPTATLKDLALGSFETCDLSIEKHCLGTTLTTQTLTDGAVAIVPQIDYTWSVCNPGIGTLPNVVVTDRLPGDASVVTEVGNLTGCYEAGVLHYIPRAVDNNATNPCEANFTNTVTALGGTDAAPFEASASATCPLCPCNGGNGDAGTD